MCDKDNSWPKAKQLTPLNEAQKHMLLQESIINTYANSPSETRQAI